MRVLLTGNEGYIGGWLASHLCAAGAELRTFDRRAPAAAGPGAAAVWEGRAKALGGPAGAAHTQGDLCCPASPALARALSGCDAVLHAAAVPGDGDGAETEILTANVLGTWNLLRACVEAGTVRRVVCLSSINALGCVGGQVPAARLPLDDAYPAHPLTAYQFSKHAMEDACRAFSLRHGLETVCLRAPFVARPESYGPGWRPDDMPVAVREYWTYIDVRDLCGAAGRALEAPSSALPPGGHAAHLVSAADTTAGQDTRSLLARHHSGAPWRPGEPPSDYFDGAPFRSLIDWAPAADSLGWTPRFTWRQG